MTVEFLWDCCTIAFVADGLDESLKERFPCTGFHWTHDSITTIEQEHCHPYQPLATIDFIFTLIDYITNPKASWPVDSDTVVAYSQVQRFHDTWRELCKNPAIQAQTPRAFSRSCRSSEWSYSSGHQSTVAAAIISCTILDLTLHSLLVVVTGFGRHAFVAVATRVYSTKCCIGYGISTPAEISSILMRRNMSPLINRMFLDFPRVQDMLLWLSLPVLFAPCHAYAVTLWLVHSSPVLNPDRGHCVVFLGKKLRFHTAFLHPGI